MKFRQFVPMLDWLPSYKKSNLKGDLSAGLTVGVMLIPQGMAYAMLAGLDPIYGLYASIVPLLLYAVLGTSRQLAVGPVAMVSLLVAAGVGAITSDPAMYVSLAVLLALMVGVIQLAMGVFKLGFLVNFLSHPVISGFTSAAALIIGFSQFKHLLGVNIPRSNYVHEIIGNAFGQIDQVNMITLLIGVVAIGVILLIKKKKWPVPGPLVAVVFGVLAVWLMGFDAQGVKIVGEVPKGLPPLSLPMINLEYIQQLLPTALTISFIGFMESIAVAKAVQAKHRNYKVIPNQELIALGVANIGGAFFKAFPTTGGFSRTAVNDQSGAKTGLASIISVFLIVLTLLFLTPLFYYLPKAILASVIMVAVFGLIDIKEAIHLWKADRTDFWMLIATFTGTLFLGIEEGILIGVVLSLGMLIYRTTRPHIAELGKIKGSRFYKNVERFDDLESRDDILVVRFDARLYYANINFFKDKIEQFVAKKGPNLKLVILDGESINGVDSSAISALEDVIRELNEKSVAFNLVGVKGPLRDAFYKSHFIEKLGEDQFFMTIQDAVDEFDNKSIAQTKGYVLQTNEE